MFIITLLQKFKTYALIKKSQRFRRIYSESSKALMLIVDYEQLMDNVIARIHEIAKTDAIFVFMHNHDISRFELNECRGYKKQEGSHFYFRADDPLARWFGVNRTYLNVSRSPAIISYFNEHERNILNESGIRYLFPLLAMNHVIGFIGLTTSGTDSGISDDNIEILNIFFAQAALAFENAYLYQQQKNRLTKMYRADRLATVGQLAAGAAHEIRNPLTTIRSAIQYLNKNADDEGKRNMMQGVLEEVDRINVIIEGMLSLSKSPKPEIEKVNLEEILGQTILLAGTTAQKKGCDIALEYKIPQKELRADPSLLKQVFLNLIMNALEAMDTRGRLVIAVTLTDRNGKSHAGFRSSYIISFHDNGAGIPKEQIEQVFNPFFTTKRQGTGLGLSISYGIIRQHGGDMEIESNAKNEKPEGHGTIVTISLPAQR